jgi:hypothetical protein
VRILSGKRRVMPRREISDRETSDIRTLMRFVEIFCQQNHNGSREPFTFKLLDLTEIEKREVLLCPDCTRLLTYGLTMRLRCPHDPKPVCKKCKTQCYKGDYKAAIREIMKFSGRVMIKRGRLDMLYHYLR